MKNGSTNIEQNSSNGTAKKLLKLQKHYKQIMDEKNYIPASALITIDNIPDILGFVQEGLSGILSKIGEMVKDVDFCKKVPTAIIVGNKKYDMTVVRKLALERLSTWRYIKTSNILST
jgi:hypothetical protein